MGGIGNQLFQFAAGTSLALRHRTDFVLDLGWFRYEGRDVTTRRSFSLPQLGINARTVAFTPSRLQRWDRGARAMFFSKRRLKVIRQREGEFRADARVLGAPDDVLLLGYWQSELYFADHGDALRATIRFPPATRKYERYDGVVEQSTAIAVHIRRADYVTDAQTNAVHGVLQPAYYRRALDYVASCVRDPTAVVFSDDPEWVRAEFACPFRLIVVDGGDAVQDLRLMSRCSHHIIANSSFSWWGAWLGERPQSVVVAPEQWFMDETVDTRDVVPLRWQRL
jgi:hypothetical protein